MNLLLLIEIIFFFVCLFVYIYILHRDPKQLNLNVIFGFILNIPNDCDFWKNALTFFTSSRRHWIAVRKFDSQYYNLDSKLKEPITIGQVSQSIIMIKHINLIKLLFYFEHEKN